MCEIKQKTIDEWTMHVSEQEKGFDAVDQCLEILPRWVSAFPREDTWVQNYIKIPSLLVRFDCIGGENGGIYEIEERPSGVGVSCEVSRVFKDNLSRVSLTWPEYQVAVSNLRVTCDDYLWGRKTITLAEAETSNSLLLVRAEPEEIGTLTTLESRSVSSMGRKGDKSYGIELGLWKQVSSKDELPWTDGFVLKPLQGSKCRGVEIWTPQKRVPGISTKSRIEKVLKQNESMYCQPFIHPLNSGIKEFPNMIYRVFFGYNIGRKGWECLGGLWMARPNLKIHGATDSLIGPIIFG